MWYLYMRISERLSCFNDAATFVIKHPYRVMILCGVTALLAVLVAALSHWFQVGWHSSQRAGLLGSFILGCGLMFMAALLFDIKSYLRYGWPFAAFHRRYRRYQASRILKRHLVGEKKGDTLADGEAIRCVTGEGAVASHSTSISSSTTEDSVAVIACYFNPVGWLSLRHNYQRFVAHMRERKVNLFCAEVAFPGQSFPSKSAFIQISATDQNVLWQKERLFNLIVEKLPAQFDKIAFVDADILFFDPTWMKRSRETLREKVAVQPFSRVYKLDNQGRVEAAFKSVGAGGEDYVLEEHRPGRLWSSPGVAWVVHRTVFPLYDRAIDGAGDSLMIHAWTGQKTSTAYASRGFHERAFFDVWADGAFKKVRGRIGDISGECFHLYHGKASNRGYNERSGILRAERYDPACHVYEDRNGLLAWTAEAPLHLKQELANYFKSRQEDEVLHSSTAGESLSAIRDTFHP